MNELLLVFSLALFAFNLALTGFLINEIVKVYKERKK